MDDVFKKCPNGIYSEIKYDGERVQLHKSEIEFKFFSRSLKPVLGHKVNIFNINSILYMLLWMSTIGECWSCWNQQLVQLLYYIDRY